MIILMICKENEDYVDGCIWVQEEFGQSSSSLHKYV